MQEDEIKARILYKLARKRKWGASHTSFDNLHKGFKNNLGKEVRQAAEELMRAGLVLQKPTGYGLEVSLNPQKKQEITSLIEEHLPGVFLP